MSSANLRAEARALIAEIAAAKRALAETRQVNAPLLQLRVAALCAQAAGLPRDAARDLLATLADLKLALDDLAFAWQGKAAPPVIPPRRALAPRARLTAGEHLTSRDRAIAVNS
jgi:uncharacterized protein YukE